MGEGSRDPGRGNCWGQASEQQERPGPPGKLKRLSTGGEGPVGGSVPGKRGWSPGASENAGWVTLIPRAEGVTQVVSQEGFSGCSVSMNVGSEWRQGGQLGGCARER